MALHTETEPTPAPAGRAEPDARPNGSPREDAAPPPARRPPIALFVVGVVAIALLVLGLRQWSFSRTHVVSDDAQVEGHIIPVLPRVSGYVAEVRVSENQNVRAGDTLVLLDNRDYRARLDQTEADLAAAIATAGERGRSGQSQSQLAAARAAVAQAQASEVRARSDVARYRTLAERGVVSRQQLDNAEAAAAVAQAQLDGARDQVAAASAAVRNADSKVLAASAARDQAALQLGYTALLAPHDGVVSKKTAEVGQLVQPGQPLMAVVPLDDIWVVANLKETEIRDVNPGDRAEVEVDSYAGRRFKGHVESLSPATGAKFSLLPPDNATGNFTKVVQRIPVRIRLDGPMDPQHPLRPGMSVKAIVTSK